MPYEFGFHSRGYLPHVKVNGATYFVTFRLADSLPAEIIIRLKGRREDLKRRAQQLPAEPSCLQCKEYWTSEADGIDALLDRSHGEVWLSRPSIASLVSSALIHFSTIRYQLAAWVVMPNHVHVVVCPQPGQTLEKIVHSWKSFTANQANRILGRSGQPFWQKESYDHWIRDEADLIHCCHYTEMNPVKASLCAYPGDWPWSSASQRPRIQ